MPLLKNLSDRSKRLPGTLAGYSLCGGWCRLVSVVVALTSLELSAVTCIEDSSGRWICEGQGGSVTVNVPITGAGGGTGGACPGGGTNCVSMTTEKCLDIKTGVSRSMAELKSYTDSIPFDLSDSSQVDFIKETISTNISIVAKYYRLENLSILEDVISFLAEYEAKVQSQLTSVKSALNVLQPYTLIPPLECQFQGDVNDYYYCLNDYIEENYDYIDPTINELIDVDYNFYRYILDTYGWHISDLNGQYLMVSMIKTFYNLKNEIVEPTYLTLTNFVHTLTNDYKSVWFQPDWRGKPLSQIISLELNKEWEYDNQVRDLFEELRTHNTQQKVNYLNMLSGEISTTLTALDSVNSIIPTIVAYADDLDCTACASSDTGGGGGGGDVPSDPVIVNQCTSSDGRGCGDLLAAIVSDLINLGNSVTAIDRKTTSITNDLYKLVNDYAGVMTNNLSTVTNILTRLDDFVIDDLAKANSNLVSNLSSIRASWDSSSSSGNLPILSLEEYSRLPALTRIEANLLKISGLLSSTNSEESLTSPVSAIESAQDEVRTSFNQISTEQLQGSFERFTTSITGIVNVFQTPSYTESGNVELTILPETDVAGGIAIPAIKLNTSEFRPILEYCNLICRCLWYIFGAIAGYFIVLNLVSWLIAYGKFIVKLLQGFLS